MSPFYASVTEVPRTTLPNGDNKAILVHIISIGSQKFSKGDREWYSPQVILGFEFPDVTGQTSDGDTFTIMKSQTYFVSLNKAKNGIGLREIIDGMLGRQLTSEEEAEFDISSLVGRGCILTMNVVTDKNGKEYQNITAVKQLTEMIKPKRQLIVVTPADIISENIERFGLADWIMDKIATSKERQEFLAKNPPTIDNVNVHCGINMDDENINIEDVPF